MDHNDQEKEENQEEENPEEEEKQEKKKKKIISGRKMSRREIIEAVTDPDSVVVLGENKKKSIAIPAAVSAKSEIDGLIREMDVGHNSLLNSIIRLFCEKKKASYTNAKVFIVRVKNLNKEQLKTVGLLCEKSGFTVSNILEAIQSIRRIDGPRLLALRAFIDLEGVNPGLLHQFFNTFLVQSSRDDVGDEAYEEELTEKMMTADQLNAFYSICNRLEGIEPSNALDILRSVRHLKPQHTKIINTFLQKGSVFGEKPITNDNVLNLVKLLRILPEMGNKKIYERMIKQLSKKSEQKQDLQFVIQKYKDEIVKERSGQEPSFVSRFFS